ncbi:acyltransferase family protein, partial [Gammaproteobacteria bacterium]|nr:acyltransferase family protein [Gammaproteobacteria bacterium]
MKANYSLPQDLTNLTLISFLDMSRWMAAAIVFISHLRNPLFLGYGDVLAQDKNILVQGWYFVTGWFPEGVIVFFVLSGLLVGGSGVAKVQNKAFTLKNYSIDRFSRLYVALVPALILCIILDKIG